MNHAGIWPWVFAALLVTAWSCAALEQHDNATKAELAAKLAVCVDNAVTDYEQRVPAGPLDPSPYEDGGVAPVNQERGE